MGARSTGLPLGSPAANETSSGPHTERAATTANTSSTSNAAVVSAGGQPRASASPIQSAPQPAPATPAQSTTAPSASSSATASMLPRSTASLSNSNAPSATSSSSSSSGTATPIRAQPSSSQSPRRASTSLASLVSNPQPRRRVGTVSTNRQWGSRTPGADVAMGSPTMSATEAANAVPSIFGFYSHGGNPTSQPGWGTATTASTQDYIDYSDAYRARFTHHAASPATGFMRLDGSRVRSHQPGNRPSSASFHANMSQQPTAYPSLAFSTRAVSHGAARSQGHFAHSTSTNAGTEVGFQAASLPAPPATFEETTTISFTWTIRDLHLLREEVELSPPPSEGGRSVSAGAGKSDVWTNQPVFGDNKWKLELVRTTRPLTGGPQDAGTTSNDPEENEELQTPASNVEPISVPEADSGTTHARRDRITVLSVYLTSLVLDYTHPDLEIPASIMVGLRPIRDAIGRRGAENGGWSWRRFYDYTFRKEADLFTCHDLPSVTEMLHDPSVVRDDAIALTIQLGLGPGHTRSQRGQLGDAATTRGPVEVDGHQLVPRAVLSSLHGLLDDANTGDVRILVRERGVFLSKAFEDNATSDDGDLQDSLADQLSRVVPYPVGSCFPASSSEEREGDPFAAKGHEPDRIFVRDRVLWAHASVLKSRSDYFHTMLASEFSEGISRTFGSEANATSRKVRTLRIPDADFVTAYWFLRYLYTDTIEFDDSEDVRSAVLDEEWAKGADLGYLTAGSTSGETGLGGRQSNMLVDWTAISQLQDYDDGDMDDARTSTSYSMTRGQPSASPVDRRDVSGSFVLHKSPPSRSAAASSVATSGSLRQRTGAGGVGVGPSGINAGSSGGGTFSAPASPSGPGAATSGGSAGKYHATDESGRVSGSHRTMSNASGARALGTQDPHEHPCSNPGPASALSIFKLAHRYHMEELCKLASLHIVGTLTPQSAFAMLLATSMYTELHTSIKTYVYQHWHLVSNTHEFERCCDEVSMGMWGADAGKTMRAFVRSLVSPLRASAA